MISDIIAALFLFWPLMGTIIVIGIFTAIWFLAFLTGAVIISVFLLYGIYSFLRDSGILDTIVAKAGKLRDYVSENVQRSVATSLIVKGEVPEGPVLFTCHPHGLYCFSWFLHFCSGLTEWPATNRPSLAIHSIFFKIPIVREFIRWGGCIEATEESIEKTLREGKSVALVLGGIEELRETRSGLIHIVAKKRTGYARIAMKTGVPIVPLVTVGENELFPFLHPDSSLPKMLHDYFGIAYPIPSFHGIQNWFSIAWQPLKKPLLTHVLPSIDTSHKTQKVLCEEYIETLRKFPNVHIVA